MLLMLLVSLFLLSTSVRSPGTRVNKYFYSLFLTLFIYRHTYISLKTRKLIYILFYKFISPASQLALQMDIWIIHGLKWYHRSLSLSLSLSLYLSIYLSLPLFGPPKKVSTDEILRDLVMPGLSDISPLCASTSAISEPTVVAEVDAILSKCLHSCSPAKKKNQTKNKQMNK